MNEKRKKDLYRTAGEADYKSTEGNSYGTSDSYDQIAREESADRAGKRSVKRQTKIEADRHERQRKARVDRAKVKLKEKAAKKRNPMAPEGKMKDVGKQYPNVKVAPEMGPDKTPPMK